MKRRRRKGLTYFLKAAEIAELSAGLASSFEKKPKPLKVALCPDLAGLFGGGEGEPTLFHIEAPPPLPSEVEGVPSFFLSGLPLLGLASKSIHFPPDAFSMLPPSPT